MSNASDKARAEKEKRLAEALRANLRRRKQAARKVPAEPAQAPVDKGNPAE